jgi:hypothetical protein
MELIAEKKIPEGTLPASSNEILGPSICFKEKPNNPLSLLINIPAETSKKFNCTSYLPQ